MINFAAFSISLQKLTNTIVANASTLHMSINKIRGTGKTYGQIRLVWFNFTYLLCLFVIYVSQPFPGCFLPRKISPL